MYRMSEKISKFELRPLGKCVEVLDRLRKPINSDARRNRRGDIPYYGANGQVGTIDEWIFDEDLVLVAEDGGFFEDPIRPISYRISGKSWVNNHAHVLRPINGVDIDWLNFAICQQDIRHLIKGATRKKLNQRELKEILIPYPPITEQRRIVARIKDCMVRVDEIEKLKTDAINERDYLLKSLIEAEYQTTEGEEVLLGDVCTITSGLIDPRENEFLDLFHVGGANIESKTGKLLDLKTAKDEKLKSSKFVFDESMVLYNKIRPYLMKVARPGFSGLCSADMYPLSPNSKRLTRDYLFYLLLSRGFTKYAIDGSNRAGMPKVNRKHLFAFEFILPSVEEQNKMTQVLDSAFSAVEKLRDDMNDTANDVCALSESILRKAFAGEL